MSWKYSRTAESGGTCLSYLAVQDSSLKSIFYPLFRSSFSSTSPDFEAQKKAWDDYHASLPKAVSLFNENNGFSYEYEESTSTANGVTISNSEKGFPQMTAKQVHWAVNYVRFLGERPERWELIMLLIKHYKLDIKLFEAYILAHSLNQTCEVVGETVLPAFVGGAISDQTMLNGYNKGVELRTVLTRLFDILEEDNTPALSRGYIYWDYIDYRLGRYVRVSTNDVETYRAGLTFTSRHILPTEQALKLGKGTSQVVLDNLVNSAHVLRKYLERLDGMV